MDELNPCLLPCNMEQLNDRINSLGLEIARMGENETLRVRKAFLIATLGYMEELLGMRREEENHRPAPDNPPLTCNGCEHNGNYEAEYEYGYPSPCTGCKRRASDNYVRKPEQEATP